MNREKWQLLQHQATLLRNAIEMNQPEATIGGITRGIVETLGGTANISNMSPGAAAIYIFALMIVQTSD